MRVSKGIRRDRVPEGGRRLVFLSFTLAFLAGLVSVDLYSVVGRALYAAFVASWLYVVLLSFRVRVWAGVVTLLGLPALLWWFVLYGLFHCCTNGISP
jgi:hypothetical protein